MKHISEVLPQVDLSDPAVRQRIDEEFVRKEAQHAKQQQEHLKWWRTQKRKESCIPDMFMVKMDSAKDLPPVIAAREFAANKEALFLIFSGSAGIGKTLAACIGLELCGYGHFETAASMLSIMPFKEDHWEHAFSVRCLVLDDLGWEYRGPNSPCINNFQNLVAQRHARNRKTIITTNLEEKEFLTTYMDCKLSRTISRIMESGKFVRLSGKDMRMASVVRKPQEPPTWGK